MASDDAKAREAAERAAQELAARYIEMFPSCDQTIRAVGVACYLRGHADASASLLHVDGLRVPCKSCGGKDTAKVTGAECYSCRNRPYWRIEELETSLRELQAAAVEYRAASEGYYEAVAEEAECTGKWLTAAEQQSKAAERRLEAADASLAALLPVPAEGAKGGG